MPFNLNRILVPIDFSNCSLEALHYALGLAARFKATIILLHVVEPAICPENYVATSTLDDVNQNLLDSGRERLTELAQRGGAHRVSTEMIVRIGRAESEIADTAKATGSDLIVMGASGQTNLKHISLGGTAERVLRHSTCPVLTVHHHG